MNHDIFQKINHISDEPLSKHTTFRIGGPAKYIFMPKNSDEIKQVIEYCKKNKEKYIVLGNGSNVLFSDEGYDGIVIQIYNSFKDIDIKDDKIYAQSGALLSRIAATARDNSLGGMEFAAGIPGTLGGAIVMNAGAYGGEMKDIVSFVDILEPDGEIKRYSCEEMEFGYRHSIVNKDRVVLGAQLVLQACDKAAIADKMNELKEARISKQPLEYPSAGSTFKRPEGYFAGKLIDDCGLRGYRVGGAMVSKKHCGFVINYNNTTCGDVVELMNNVSDMVNDKFGVRLEPEVKIIL